MWRSGIGFDHLFDVLGQAAKVEQSGNYPPYDIERTGEDAYRLTVAAAGWVPDEISVITEPNVLIVSGRKAEPEGKQYLYRCISRQKPADELRLWTPEADALHLLASTASPESTTDSRAARAA
jgi:HSP20 family molecular chaperone IbpA